MVYSKQDKFFQDNIDEMVAVSKELMDARRKNPSDKKDLLNAMMKGKDPKTGEGLDDDTIIKNMITFLIAGKFGDNIYPMPTFGSDNI